MKITHFRVLSSLISEARLPLSIIFLILVLANTISLIGQSRLATSPLYEKAAQPLRSAPIKEYEFDKASVRDVLRFLANDAGIVFVAMPEEGNDGAKLITFSLKKSLFSTLETIEKLQFKAWLTSQWFLLNRVQLQASVERPLHRFHIYQ